MINKIKNLFIFLFFFIVSCIKLLVSTFFSILKLKDAVSDGTVWFAIFYQPFLVLIVVTLFVDKIDLLLDNFLNGQGNFISALFLSIELIAIVLLINSLIELLFRIQYKNSDFKTFFSIQKYAHNYMQLSH